MGAFPQQTAYMWHLRAGDARHLRRARLKQLLSLTSLTEAREKALSGDQALSLERYPPEWVDILTQPAEARHPRKVASVQDHGYWPPGQAR